MTCQGEKKNLLLGFLFYNFLFFIYLHSVVKFFKKKFSKKNILEWQRVGFRLDFFIPVLDPGARTRGLDPTHLLNGFFFRGPNPPVGSHPASQSLAPNCGPIRGLIN